MNGHLINRNGTFHVRVDFKDSFGKWKSKTRSTKLPVKDNKKRAEKMLEEFITECEKSMSCVITDFQDILFTDFMDKWLELVKASVAKSTFAGYRNCIKKIKEYFEPMNIKLMDLKPIHLQEFYNKKLEDGVKAITVHHYHANIHKSLKYAVKMEIIPTNPSDKVDLPRSKSLQVISILKKKYRNYLMYLRETNVNYVYILQLIMAYVEVKFLVSDGAI